MELDPSQERAVELVCTAPFAILTGGPGTGKSTCLRVALDRMDKARTRHNFIVLDACRDNPFASSFKVSSAGLAQYSHGGFTVLTPTVFGDSSAVPAAIKSELGS